MKKSLFESRRVMRLLAIALIFTWLPGAAWSEEVFDPNAIVVPPPDLNPLNQIPIPQPPNVFQYVTNKTAAIQLGKAFYWDMQVGSDGLTACATCHFSAGADNRRKNTLNPGTKGGDTIFGNSSVPGVPGLPQFAPNYTLQDSDFPFHLRAGEGHSQSDALLRDVNDVVGSQGVRLSDFVSIEIVNGVAVENTTPVPDPIFNVNGVNVRQVTGRNTPTVINAIFNFNNFWDGRASFIFNGQNPFGLADPNAGVWFNVGGTLEKQRVALQFAGIASQATGPPLDTTEMSARGRIFPDIGRKLLNSTPLGKQLVSHDDSILGSLANSASIPGAKGLHTSYDELIKAAFAAHLWNSPNPVTITRPNGQPAQFTQMEANFAFFWGLSIQFYLATLVSDQTPYDRWLGGDAAAMTDQQKLGFALFNGNAKCTLCHTGIETTAASHSSAAYLNDFLHALIELMFVADGTQVIYDNGYNNTAVTKTTDDIGRGGTTPFANPLNGNQPYPLSFSALAELKALNQLPFSTPIMDPFLPVDMPVNANGAFKVPGLRNVALTAPYFHNGGAMNLDDVLDLYIRGGNFPVDNLHDLDPDVHAGLSPLIGDEVNEHAIIAFMESLTDPRVAAEQAPFDHPELFIPEGDPEVLTRLPAVDFNGVPVASTFSFDPVATPTNVDTQNVSGTVEAGATVEVTVNGGAPIPAIVTGIGWSATITGLVEGPNTIVASAVIGGVLTTATTTIILDTVAPALTLNAVTSPTNVATQNISGTVEAGATVRVSVNGGSSTLAAVTGASWSYTVTLIEGTNTLSVTAIDTAGNTTTLPPAAITAVLQTLLVDRATYVRSSQGRVDVWATAPVGTALDVTGGPNLPPSPVPMVGDGTGKFFVRIPVADPAALPASITVTLNRGLPSQLQMSNALIDVVSITKAEHNLTTGVLTVQASSSDTLAQPNGPTLTAQGFGTLVSGGLIVTGIASPPAGVTVTSSKGGSFTVPVSLVEGPASQPDTLTVTAAEYRQTGREWRIDGTSLPAPAQPRTVTIYLGPTVGGAVIGTANVAADGKWSFRQTSSSVMPPSTLNQKISVQSSSGGKLENVSLMIRR